MFGDPAVILTSCDIAPSQRARWMRAEPIPEPADAERLELAPGIWIVRQRQWWPVSVLDSAQELPWDADAQPVRRKFPHPPWHSLAACLDQPSELFFGADDEGQVIQGEYLGRGAKLFRSARALCESCPVRVDCLTHALTQPEEFGVWAGTTGRRRVQLRARLAAGEPLEQVVTECLNQ